MLLGTFQEAAMQAGLGVQQRLQEADGSLAHSAFGIAKALAGQLDQGLQILQPQ